MLCREVITNIHALSDIDSRRALEAAFGFAFIRHPVKIGTRPIRLSHPETTKEEAKVVLKINEVKEYRIICLKSGLHAVELSVKGGCGELYLLIPGENTWRGFGGFFG